MEPSTTITKTFGMDGSSCTFDLADFEMLGPEGTLIDENTFPFSYDG